MAGFEWSIHDDKVRGMMRVITVLTAALALIPVASAADGIQPGLWKITTTVMNNGIKSPPQTNTRCLTAKQANDLADAFSPRFGGVNTQCERTQYAKSKSELKWRLECRGQINMDSAAVFTFFSSLRYTATISTKAWMGNHRIADSKVTLEGEFVGPCHRTDDARPE